MPSPNEDGPTMSFKYVNVPNAPQDGYNSRRQRQSLEDDTVNAPQRRLTVPSTPTRNIGFTVLQTMRRPIPPLRIVTTPKAVVPPPQIAIPTLPLTPFSASLTNAVDAVGTAATEGAGEGRAQKFHHEQLTPVSSVCSNASLKESKTLTLDQEPNIGGAMTVGGRKRSYSNLVKRSLAESPRLGGSSPSRQRALSTTRLPVPIRPLTTSSAHRDARAAR
ncbi:hypothetical protein BC939DRAFT_442355 [Gamsiella multidivaricata]|uniref:uncharacterized protein n=1 Tax=Gamsiella multidivaricata TaxID=101098 RepID=UPI00221FD8F7|nr:uncharacterized protein BC939DRAFT_442355 [Gamsiella multidivaricata]KAI7828947.1 hypothetical protein BC939DRAFT_442355 [Gamsiella multidivaricata]